MVSKLRDVLNTHENLELAILVGSQAENCAHSDSDWDIAIQWDRELGTLENLGSTETLRRDLAKALNVEESLIDLINIPNAGLAMRALIAEKGQPLKGQDGLAWNHFLSRIWRELEMYEWQLTQDKKHAS